MIRVIIERRCRPDKETEIENLLIDLRAVAAQQRGFISGETLKSIDDPMLWVVISTWVDDDTWKTWNNSPVRCEIMNKMEPLMFVPEKISVYNFIRHGIAQSAHAMER
ncbi:antibiotic biosynthesis monooxygenase family protein [Chloroflexota bacterium]